MTPTIVHNIFRTCSKTEIMQLLGVDDIGYTLYRDMHEKGMETHRISMFVFLIVDHQTNTPIGECGFHTWNKAHRRAELFYLLRNETDKRKGYMSEALPEVLRYGFEHLNLHRIEALVAAYNIPSVKLLQHNGFTKEGTMREDYVVDGTNEDFDCYSLLRHEWSHSTLKTYIR